MSNVKQWRVEFSGRHWVLLKSFEAAEAAMGFCDGLIIGSLVGLGLGFLAGIAVAFCCDPTR